MLKNGKPANLLAPASGAEDWLNSKSLLGCVSEQWSAYRNGIWHVIEVSLRKLHKIL